jgi:hypothetical protein
LSKEKKECLASFNISDYEFHLAEIDHPVFGTCRWILDHERYIHWKEDSVSSLLWLSADAGCGKSVLANYLITYLKSLGIPKPNVCFFFFKDGLHQQADSIHALSAILHQIFSSQPELLEYAASKYRTMGATITTRFHTLWDILERTVSDEKLRDTICVIDALDECEESTGKMLLAKLAEHFAPGHTFPPSFKVIITSRPDNSIKTALRNIPDIRLRGEDVIDPLSRDIKLLVQTRVNEMATGADFPPDLLTDLQQDLIRGADFTFLWTSLATKLPQEASSNGMSKNDLREILHTRQVDDIYKHMLRNRPHALKAKKILYIIIAAGRPLTLRELSVAVEVHDDCSIKWRVPLEDGNRKLKVRIDRDRRRMEAADPSQSHNKIKSFEALEERLHHPFSNYIRSLCGHFLRIRKERVYLVHQTAREFLLRPMLEGDFSVGYYLRDFQRNVARPTDSELLHMREFGIPGTYSGDKNKHKNSQVFQNSVRLDVANRYLLQVCIDYLALFGTSDGQELIQELEEHRFDQYESFRGYSSTSFLQYATRYWVDHYRIARRELNGAFDDLCSPDHPIFSLWIQQHPPYLDSLRPDGHRGAVPFPGFNAAKDSIQKATKMGVIDFFDLDNETTSLYVAENFYGPRYWKVDVSDEDPEDTRAGSEVDSDTQAEESLKQRRTVHSTLPHRMQFYHNEHRKTVRQDGLESGNPGTGNSFPTINGGVALRFGSSSIRNKEKKRDISTSIRTAVCDENDLASMDH